ncbi:hypothetical protein G6Z90_05845 [Vibrio aestuarianus subsp. cardii]|uniref:hypothetical protein n=1 Tax=Vibrio aestuarianus TaxID=28171 RepID=UPI0015935DB1|nr:hypothetical protein [Vibrio aestuarianus]MDE1311503.1 hypothetical protein [Vibrio aestuarianus]NGZ19237.1 hypothetical protein [Vibrio aestuarianus]NGZ92034.1 hypothetical protein [Vibrio aestuarianus subsp. cardii]
MCELTTEQTDAMATFKHSLHLPGGGFHALIVELCREFQLPFQVVRSVLKQAQASIETKIRDQFDNVVASDLTKEHWLSVIKDELNERAKDNIPLMESLLDSEIYRQFLNESKSPIRTESERECLLEHLMQAYEQQVYKPLKAMLYTTVLQWQLPNDLLEMTEETRQLFNNYPQHMEASAFLFKLSEQIRSQPLSEN